MERGTDQLEGKKRKKKKKTETTKYISINMYCISHDVAENIQRIGYFNIAYAFNASFSVRHSDGIQASFQAGGILFIAVLTAPKGLISAT